MLIIIFQLFSEQRLHSHVHYVATAPLSCVTFKLSLPLPYQHYELKSNFWFISFYKFSSSTLSLKKEIVLCCCSGTIIQESMLASIGKIDRSRSWFQTSREEKKTMLELFSQWNFFLIFFPLQHANISPLIYKTQEAILSPISIATYWERSHGWLT